MDPESMPKDLPSYKPAAFQTQAGKIFSPSGGPFLFL